MRPQTVTSTRPNRRLAPIVSSIRVDRSCGSPSRPIPSGGQLSRRHAHLLIFSWPSRISLSSPGRSRRFEAEAQPCSSRLCKALQGAAGRNHATALQACNSALRCFHPGGQLFLREACPWSGLDDGRCEREFLLQRVVLPAIFGILHPFLVKVG